MMLSIRATLISTFCGLLVVVLLPIGFLVHREAHEMLVEHALRNAQLTVKLQGQRIAEWLEGNDKELSLLSELDLIRDFEQEKIYYYLRRKVLTRKDIHEIIYANPQGQAWSTLTPGMSRDIRHTDYFLTLLREGTTDRYLSDVEADESSGYGKFYLLRTVYSLNAERVGLLGAGIRLEQLEQLLSPGEIPGSYGWLVDRHGHVIAHPSPAVRMKVNVMQPPEGLGYVGLREIGQRMLARESGYAEVISPAGDERLVVFAPVPGISGWSYAQSIPTSVLFARVQQFSALIVIASALAITGFALLIWMLAHRISRPIELLVAHTHRLSKGHFSERLALSKRSAREIHALIDDFNHMASNINLTVNNLLHSERETALINVELASQQQALKESEERYRLAMEATNDILWDLDLQQNTAIVSQRWESLHEQAITTPQDWLHALQTLIHPDDWPTTQNKLNETLSGRNTAFVAEFRLKLKNGHMVWRLCRGKALLDDDGRVTRVCGSLSDIDEQKVSHNKIRHMAFHDSLTGLPNRWFLMDRLRQTLASVPAKHGALLFMNINNFKTLNDLFGHQEGDALLKQVALRLNQLHQEDNALARLGGDEFVLLLNDINDEQILNEAVEGLMRYMRAPFLTQRHEHRISVSIGVALYPEDGQESSDLMRKADMALQAAKECGRNRWKRFDANMLERVRYRGEMEQALRQALNTREFELHYQPQLQISSGQIIGFEALCRWTRPDYGPVSPAKFIPLAEDTGHILALGNWVLSTACFQLAQWRRNGFLDIGVAVNVSSLQLKNGFVDYLRQTMERAGVGPEQLEIEITESVMMQSFQNQLDILHTLRDMGIRISLDDFGTGYSSLSYLRRLPIAVVKIDKSFVDNMERDDTTRHITENIISLAHALHLDVVAEGVETETQLQLLGAAECEVAQGYFIGRPMPPAEAEGRLQQGNATKKTPGNHLAC